MAAASAAAATYRRGIAETRNGEQQTAINKGSSIGNGEVIGIRRRQHQENEIIEKRRSTASREKSIAA